MSRPPTTTAEYTVEWLGVGGEEIAVAVIRKPDLAGAVRWAAAQLTRESVENAQGFFVQLTADREEDE